MIIKGIYSILLVPAFIFAMAGKGCKKEVEVEVGKAEKRTIIASVSESGVVEPDIDVPVAPDVSGEITAIYIKEGDLVTKGQLLFEIRPDNYKAALEQSNAALNTAKADFENAQVAIINATNNLVQDSITYMRQKGLYEQQVIPLVEYEAARLKYNISRGQLDAAKQSKTAAYYRIQSAAASTKQATDNLNRTRVYAGMTGTITVLNAEVGQRVVGTGMMSGTEVIKIADLSRMKVKVMINENDIVNVHLGDTASIEVDAYLNRKFQGVVTKIAYSANVAAIGSQDQITNYPVEVLIKPESYVNDPELMKGLAAHQSPFRPGMSAVVDIFTRKVENVVAVPIQSVTIDKEETGNAKKDLEREIVYLYGGDTVSVREVVTGLSDDDFIEIKKGLKEGDELVTGSYTTITKTLKSGLKVMKEDKTKKKAEKAE